MLAGHKGSPAVLMNGAVLSSFLPRAVEFGLLSGLPWPGSFCPPVVAGASLLDVLRCLILQPTAKSVMKPT